MAVYGDSSNPASLQLGSIEGQEQYKYATIVRPLKLSEPAVWVGVTKFL